MSGKCGGCCQRSSLTRIVGSIGIVDKCDIAKAAAATLCKLNSLMKQTNDWHGEKSKLESNVRSLRLALQEAGKIPEEALRPDPLIIQQRDEIARLEVARENLEGQVADLRRALIEAEGAITCSGVKKWRENLSEVRKANAEERSRLVSEISSLKLKLREAEEDSSCSALNRLRKKLREILNGDEKLDEVIGELAARGCATMVALTEELTRLKLMMENSNLENIQQDAEIGRLKRALVVLNGGQPFDSEYQKRFEDLQMLTRQQERRIEDLLGVLDAGGGSKLAERAKELEEDLEEAKKLLKSEEIRSRAIRNELTGAKAAYNSKLKELEATSVMLENMKKEAVVRKSELREREDRIVDLLGQLEAATESSCEVEKLRREVATVESETCKLEVERDRLLEDVVKLRVIVSERNDRIAKVLGENERLEKSRRAEVEGVRIKLTIALAEKDKLGARLKEVEGDLEVALIKFNEINQASGDSPRLRDEIKELGDEIVKVKGLLDEANGNLAEANYKTTSLEEEVRKSRDEKRALKRELARLEDKLMGVELKNDAKGRREFGTNTSRRRDEELAEESESLRGEMVKMLKEARTIASERDKLAIELTAAKRAILTRMKGSGAEKTGANNEMRRVLVEKMKGRIVDAGVSRVTDEARRGLNYAVEIKNEKRTEAENRALRTELDHFRDENARFPRDLKDLGDAGRESSTSDDKIENKWNSEDRLEQELKTVKKERTALRNELMRLRDEIERLRANLRISTKASKELSELNSLSHWDSANESKSWEHNTVDNIDGGLGTENVRLKRKIGELESKNQRTSSQDIRVRSRSRAESTETSKVLDKSVQTSSPTDEKSEKIRDHEDGSSDSGQFVETRRSLSRGVVFANEELKCNVRFQNSAVKRIKDFISYVNGTITLKPTMPMVPAPSLSALSRFHFDDTLMETLKMSQQLSKRIFHLEIQVRKLESSSSGTKHFSVEPEHRTSYVHTPIGKNALVHSCTKVFTMKQTDVQRSQNSSFHNSTSHSTFNIETMNPDYHSREDNRFVGMNQRICALQNEIKIKQRETARKVRQMRQAIEEEQFRLMEAAGNMNVFH